MKLYLKPGACSLSPHIALEESGLPYETEVVDLKTKITASGADFTKSNPKGYVPALLLDSGELLTEGAAIVQYIADQAPAKKLAPANGTIERYRLQSWLNFIGTELHKSCSPFFNPASGDDWKKIAAANAPFVSRGDKSGTDAAEKRFWTQAGLASRGSGYKECGCGMGPALNMAASSGAYVLADRGTWLSFKNRADLAVLVEGDTRLFNQYGVMVVNPERHPHVKQAEARKFVEWVVSPAGQDAIAEYKIEGEQLFFPNAGQ